MSENRKGIDKLLTDFEVRKVLEQLTGKTEVVERSEVEEEEEKKDQLPSVESG